MSLANLKAYQGRQYNRVLQLVNLDKTPAVGVFNNTTTLACNVWEGGNQASLFQPTVTWYTGTTPVQTGYDQGQVMLSIAAAQTTALDPAGWYMLLIDTTTGGLTAPGWEGRLAIAATPGSTSPSPPDLISYDQCLAMLAMKGITTLTDDQQDALPLLITAASQAWRLECNNQYFDQRTLTEDHFVYQDGYLRLWQSPIQIVTRVQGAPQQLALTINNTSAQTAQAYFTYTGSVGDYTLTPRVATGIYLNWVYNGTPANATFLYATYPTVGQIAAAINSSGSGWSAISNTSYSQWLCSELVGGFVAQGCGLSSYPANGATFNILSDLTIPQLNPDSPMLWVGQQYSGNQLAQQWGPGGNEMFGPNGQGDNLGLCRVTYVSGYPTIPYEIQYQVSQIVKWKIELGVQELLLKAEKAADYDYELSMEMVHNLPRTVREAAGRWKAHYA